mgnify:CR=1 FL=1
MKNKIVAGILALLLGGLGIHAFYLGENSKGITYLVATIIGWVTSIFFIGLIPCFIIGVLCLIDGIKLLTMTDEDFNAKYNQ